MHKNRAFSMIELLLVVGIAAGIFLLSMPLGLNFYRTQLVEDTRNNIVDALGRARHNAILMKNDSAFGVEIDDDDHTYTIFQGDNYGDDNTYDEVFPIVDTITAATGLSSVTFAKLTGASSASGTINIIYGNIARDITVDGNGLISKVVE